MVVRSNQDVSNQENYTGLFVGGVALAGAGAIALAVATKGKSVAKGSAKPKSFASLEDLANSYGSRVDNVILNATKDGTHSYMGGHLNIVPGKSGLNVTGNMYFQSPSKEWIEKSISGTHNPSSLSFDYNQLAKEGITFDIEPPKVTTSKL